MQKVESCREASAEVLRNGSLAEPATRARHRSSLGRLQGPVSKNKATRSRSCCKNEASRLDPQKSIVNEVASQRAATERVSVFASSDANTLYTIDGKRV